MRVDVCWSEYYHTWAVGYFFILVFEACEVMTGLLHQGCRHCGNILM